MKFTNKLVLEIVVVLFLTLFYSFSGYSQSFESNGYDIDMDWKVKGKYLRNYGVIENGRPCWKLKVNADMGNRIYNVSAKLVSYTEQHNPNHPTIFNGKSDLGRDYKAVKGWYVDKLTVYCVGKK